MGQKGGRRRWGVMEDDMIRGKNGKDADRERGSRKEEKRQPDKGKGG